MKLTDTSRLLSVLNEISESSVKSPKDFPVIIKLLVSENIRLCRPHARDYESQRNGLINTYGKKIDGKDEEYEVGPDFPDYPKFIEELKNLNAMTVDTKFRKFYESDIGSSPLTIPQIGLLQELGILLPNDK